LTIRSNKGNLLMSSLVSFGRFPSAAFVTFPMPLSPPPPLEGPCGMVCEPPLVIHGRELFGTGSVSFHHLHHGAYLVGQSCPPVRHILPGGTHGPSGICSYWLPSTPVSLHSQGVESRRERKLPSGHYLWDLLAPRHHSMTHQ
jgi:hypothetical protein